MEIQLANKLGVELPIVEGAYQVVYEGKDPLVILVQLMVRERRSELELEEIWL